MDRWSSNLSLTSVTVGLVGRRNHGTWRYIGMQVMEQAAGESGCKKFVDVEINKRIIDPFVHSLIVKPSEWSNNTFPYLSPRPSLPPSPFSMSLCTSLLYVISLSLSLCLIVSFSSLSLSTSLSASFFLSLSVCLSLLQTLYYL